MKKSLLILSALALGWSTPAFADTLEAGTADSPNYYVLKASRGVPYLAVSAETLTNNGVETTLYRTNDISAANIWAVTPGSAEGTLKITAYGSELGLMEFKNADGVSYAMNSVATLSEPADIYPRYLNDGTVSLSLFMTSGIEIIDGAYALYSLDAGTGSPFLGNWQSNDAGTKWTAYKLDMTNGADAAIDALEIDLIRPQAEAMVAEYKGYFNGYIASVPWVANELNAGIEQLNNYVVTLNYDSDIKTIWNTACSNANKVLATVFSDKVCALKNLRRAAKNLNAYIAVNGAGSNFESVTYMADFNAQFTFKSVENGGYKLFNSNTGKYINASMNQTDSEETAAAFYPFLHANGAYSGIAFSLNADHSGNGFNVNEQAAGTLVSYGVNDPGSIWSVVEIDEAAALAEAVNSVKAMAQYIPNVPTEIATIIQPAVDQADNLKYDAQLASEAAALCAKLAESNTLLETMLDGKIGALKNLRRASGNKNSYEAVNVEGNNYLPVASADDFNAQFTFKSVGDGGYKLFNATTSTYIGNNLTPVESADDAKVVYPVLNNNSGFYGVSYPFSADKTGNGFNANNNADPTGGPLTSYGIADGGSIWGLNLIDPEAKLNEAINSVKDALEPYIPNVPAEIAAVLQKAIDEANTLEYNPEMASKAAALRTNAITEGNSMLDTQLADKVWTLKNLRRAAIKGMNSYIAVNGTSTNYLPVAFMASPNAQFTFESVEDGGYKLYNANTKTYITAAYNQTKEASEALTVYPVLNSYGNYYGVAFPFAADKTGNGFNENTVSDPVGGGLTGWNINDGGSIWGLAEYDEEQAFAEVGPTMKLVLESYIPNVPAAVGAILQSAIDAANELVYNAKSVVNPDVLLSETMADANKTLTTALTNKNWALKNLRNGFVKADTATEAFNVGQTDAADNDYDFMPTDDGGFILYSPSAKMYLGPGVEIENAGTMMTLVAEQKDAQKVYPVLNRFVDSNNNFYGISFPLTNSSANGTKGLNTNQNGMYSYNINDGGSIFSVALKSETVAIEEVEAAEAGAEVVYDLQGRRVKGNAKGLLIVNGRKVYRL